MKTALHNYDIFPKVVLAREKADITIRPLGEHAAFDGEYTVSVLSMAHGSKDVYPERDNCREFAASPEADGCIRISFTFPEESE